MSLLERRMKSFAMHSVEKKRLLEECDSKLSLENLREVSLDEEKLTIDERVETAHSIGLTVGIVGIFFPANPVV